MRVTDDMDFTEAQAYANGLDMDDALHALDACVDKLTGYDPEDESIKITHLDTEAVHQIVAQIACLAVRIRNLGREGL